MFSARQSHHRIREIEALDLSDILHLHQDGARVGH
jgi:hypothetical protein